MKHTPGPWHWESYAVKGDPYNRVRYQITAPGKTVTKVYYSSFEGGPTNAEADAKLISAAPDLLEALHNLEVAANGVSYCYDKRPVNFAAALQSLRDVAAQARELIAKVTGEAP